MKQTGQFFKNEIVYFSVVELNVIKIDVYFATAKLPIFIICEETKYIYT